MTDRNQKIETIAQFHFCVETLETRNRDSLDFHDVHVGSMKAALVAAYEEGRKAALRGVFHGEDD